MMIATVTDAYVIHYMDSGQVTAYVEWRDAAGHKGRTEGPAEPLGAHMAALLTRAERELGHSARVERWG